MVATDVDGTPEVVVDGETGLTVPPGDPEALALAIARLLRDRTLAVQLGANGKTWVSKWFNLKQQIRQTEDIYEKLWCAKTHQSLPQRTEERDLQTVMP
jgi:glycosyltransferase involved in cell wall biosynthesis